MSYVLDNYAISDDGVVTLTNGPIEGVAVALDALSDVTTVYSTLTPYRLIRAGWLSFGAYYDPDDGTTREWWTELRWIDFENCIIFPPGRANTAAGVGQYFDRVRWHLEPGASGHIWVNTF